MARDGRQRIFDTQGNLTHLDGKPVENADKAARQEPTKAEAAGSDKDRQEQTEESRTRPGKQHKKPEGRE